MGVIRTAKYYRAAIARGENRSAAGLIDRARVQTEQPAIGCLDRAVVLIGVVRKIELHAAAAHIIAIDRAVVNQGRAIKADDGAKPVDEVVGAVGDGDV